VDRFIAEFDPDSLRVPGLVFGAVGAGAERVSSVLGEEFPDVVLSHDNAPNQCIVCGPEEQIDLLMKRLRKQNVLCQALPFRSGFHTPMLEPYLGPILEWADRFELHEPSVPVWSATIAAPFPEDAAQVRELFVRHLVEPVRFRQMIEAMYEAGYRVFLQTGTGALATVISDVLAGRDHLSIPANAPQRSGLEQLRRVAAALWVEGMEPAELGGAAAAAVTSQPRSSRRVRRTPRKLALGSPLVSLGDRAPRLSAVPPSATGELAALDAFAPAQPVAAELAALLRETAESATAVLAARGRQPVAAPAAPVRAGEETGHTAVRVDIDEMPYLIDHCFFAQRAGWPDISDLFPVVPATTVVQHMMDAAESRGSGQRAIAVHGARFDRWSAVLPAHTVEITTAAEPGEPGRIKVAFGSYARSTIELAPAYPAPPAPWPVDTASERAASITAEVLYADRWMFHGPGFRGITELTALGAKHVRAVITAPAAPGALLDNVGQLLGYWIMANHEYRNWIFPVGAQRIAFHGAPPTPGTKLQCHVRIQIIDDVQLVADAQLVIGGRVWAEFTGWANRRFGSHPDTWDFERTPGAAALSHARPGGWVAVFDRWSDPASRDLRMRSYLSAAERAEYESHPLRQRAQWLLGRMAAKDAVRRQLWDNDHSVTGRVFTGQIRVRNAESGRPYVEGLHGTELPPHDVSLAHSGEVGVALARPADGAGVGAGSGIGLGIDVEQVMPRDKATYDFAFTDPEQDLLRRLVAADSTPRDEAEAVWFTRFWVAKESAAKAEGTGFRGNPKAFVVIDATSAASSDTAELTVESRRLSDTPTRHRVRTAALANPDDLPARRYEVGWTEGAHTRTQHEEN
ncbi:4'-phosphopantetheinyl transferase superfamily protein, partial [Actinospica sp.]|uniref:4'-phosphopantetheinyl transferase superfamily protein n=1 Tax=Actinospica sp. TaxID=1872142 RepID=UPI002D0E63F2